MSSCRYPGASDGQRPEDQVVDTVPLTHPWTDWFGTRLDPAVVLEGSSALVYDTELRLYDDHVQLLSQKRPRYALSQGLVWLKEQLSPLTHVAVERDDARAPGLATEEEKSTLICVAESWSEADLPMRLNDLAERLGTPIEPSERCLGPRGVSETYWPRRSQHGVEGSGRRGLRLRTAG